MKKDRNLSEIFLTAVALVTLSTLIGCGTGPKSPDVSGKVRNALDQAGLKGVTVSEDRDKGVVTLGGQVASDADKSQAESIAKSNAEGLVVADQVAVLPGNDSQAKTVNSDIDKAIEKNLDAALLSHGLKKGVRYDVKNGVVKLTGKVNSESKRNEAEKVAASVPNVQQVVNELEVRGRKATSRG
jgi:hyperosmotically inducible protein